MKKLIYGIAILLLGCATIHNFTGPPEKTGHLKVMYDGYNDYRGVIHCHSKLSHDSKGEFWEIIGAARRVGLNFLIMTDHINRRAIEEGLRGWHEGVLFLVGAEFSKGGGSILGLNLREYVDPKQSINKIIKGIKKQGGLVFIGHMEKFKKWREIRDFDGVEVYNIHADVRDENKFFLFLRALFLTPKPFFSSLIDTPYKNLKRWDSLLKERRCVAIAGNDAHQNTSLFGRKLGTYEELFKVVTTHIKAKRMDETALINALKAGHVYISFDIYGDGTGFVFMAESPNKRAIMGDEIEFNKDMELKVSSPLEGDIKLFKDGTLLKETKGDNLLYQVKERGIYRVEIYRHNKPFILSNPIYIR